MADLKSCPFCGGEAFIRRIEAHDHTPMLKALCPDLEPAEETYWPECTKCGCAKEGKPTEAEAIAAWNRRASLTEKDAEIAALRAENDRLASAVVEGTLPGLLEDAEKTALVDFVKFLRSQPGHATRALHENPESKG